MGPVILDPPAAVVVIALVIMVGVGCWQIASRRAFDDGYRQGYDDAEELRDLTWKDPDR